LNSSSFSFSLFLHFFDILLASTFDELLKRLKTLNSVRDFTSRSTSDYVELPLKERDEGAKQALETISTCWKAYKNNSSNRSEHAFLMAITGIY